MRTGAIVSQVEATPILHGGDLGAARLMFPGAPEPFVDLSTGINPDPYPWPRLPAELLARLPDSAALATLTAARAPEAPGLTLKRFDSHTRTNWH